MQVHQPFRSQTWVAAPRNAATSGIHDDDVAQGLGFEGGFVPGVTLYENLVVGLLQQDPDWLSHGRVEMRFRKPVYTGEEAVFSVDGETQAWTVACEGDERPRAWGVLAFDDEPPSVPAGEPAGQSGRPLGDPADIGTLMQTVTEFSADRIEEAARASGFPVGAAPRIVPPGLWTNPVDLLHSAFDCPVTIHSTSRIWHRSPLREGEVLLKRGRIAGFEERRGNRIVHFEAELTAAGRPIAVIAHQSVFELAKARAT